MFPAYITEIGQYLPGEPINNDEVEQYLGQINQRPSRVKSRILKNNGIRQRYYALDRNQNTTISNTQMAVAAVRDLLNRGEMDPNSIDLLAAATTWPDLLVPGFASMIHGDLSELPPLEAISHQGVCCAGMASLNYTATQVQLGQKQKAVTVASELASRLFKHTRFEAEASQKAGNSLSFDREFLRWMLSDGAGAFVVQNHPRGLSLKIEWIQLMSHANAYPLCMYAGVDDPHSLNSWMDYPSYLEAAHEGTLHLRQNVRLLEDVIRLGVEGWLRLIEAGHVDPQEVDWLLCHYSSHFFRSQIVELLTKAGCMIPEEKWFTNLYTRGNTGCASIYLMLEELFHSGKLQPGQTIFCFVPESARFTTAYMKLKVVEGKQSSPSSYQSQINFTTSSPVPPQDNTASADLLRQLTQVWLQFERELRSVPIIRRLHQGDFTKQDYKALLCNLRPQVVEGARWMTRAASNMTDFQFRSSLIGHAKEEHRDFQMLEHDYVAVGGEKEEIVTAEKNIGSEALSAFIFHCASQENPIDVLGSMFIIEGLGNQLAGKWAKLIQTTLYLNPEQLSFLRYHGQNDENHIGKLEKLLNAHEITPEKAQRIVKTAKVTARLYRLQLEEIG